MYCRKKVHTKHVLQKKSLNKTCIIEKKFIQNMYCRKKFKQNMYCRKKRRQRKQLYSFPNSKKLMKKYRTKSSFYFKTSFVYSEVEI